MDWFAETEYAATGLIAGRVNNTISSEEALKHPVIASGYISQRQDGYLHLNPNGYDAERDPSGWKFHLSVDPTQIKDAFNHIAPDLMKEGISLKVAEARKHEGFGDESNSQKGKGIVIYAKEGQDITPILKRIEQKLTDAGIKPGPTVNDDKKLGGSNFMFYRNDRDLSGNYISAASLERLPAEQRFNPVGKIDPYQSLDVSPVKPATIRPAQSADLIKFPGEKASVEEHVKYLIAATRHIADSEPSADEKYRQRLHGDGVTIGDPKKPAILNASYVYGNRSLASISMPDYIKMEYGIKFENGDVKMHPGLSNMGISISLQAVLESQGIKVDGGETKVGHDKMTSTHYIEMDLTDRTKYGHALAIVDAITQGRDKSPEAVMQQIKAINPANPIRPIPQVNEPAPHATPIAPAAITPIDPKAESRQIIATSPITDAEKRGKDGQVKKLQYMGVGFTPSEVEHIENNLKKQGFNIGLDYDLKPSSLNGGGNVISLTEQGASRIELIQHLHQQEMSKPQPAAAHTAPSILATSELTNTTKGTYMGVGASEAEFDTIRKELEKKGLKQGTDFNVKPSSVNGGNNVIVLSNESAQKIITLQEEHQTQAAKIQQPHPSAPGAATPVQSTNGASISAISSSPLAVGPTSNSGIVASSNSASQLQNQPLPHNPTPMMGSLALAPEPQVQLNLTQAPQKPVVNPATAPQAANSPAQPAAKPEQAHLEAASQTARAQLADPNYKPTSSASITPAESSSSGKLLSGGAGQKMDGHAGKASLAIQVASEAARGNYVAATTTAAVAIAEQQGIKFVAKRVPILGGVITAGMTLWGAGEEAVKGNFKKAGSELVGGAAETVGNIVGFGAGDALREVARKGLMVAGVKEENAPNKSGIRVAAETAYDLGKTIVDSAKLKTISKTDLAKSIQADPDLPHKLNLRGQEVTLVQAMEDKTFRAAMIKNMEADAKKNPALEPKVAALKEYGARLDASAPQQSQQAAAKPATTTPPSITNPTPSAAEAQYKSMSTTQLAAAIQKDQTLVDTVKIGKNDVLLADALKDKDFRKTFISGLEKAQAGGSDLHEQIAMVKAYETALGKPQQPASPAVQVAQQQPPKMAAAAMI